MTNETIASQLAHRTIRAYKDQPLTEAEVDTLMDVARHTATSSFLQACTILHITDPQVRARIADASGQPYVGGTKGDLFIFVADLYRNSRIRAEQGVSSEALSSTNLFLTGPRTLCWPRRTSLWPPSRWGWAPSTSARSWRIRAASSTRSSCRS